MNKIIEAAVGDASEILAIQKAAYLSEAELYNDYTIQPLHQQVHEVEKEFDDRLILKYVENGKILGSIRAFVEGDTCHIEKLMVDPQAQNKGIGRALMEEIENRYSDYRFELFTGSKSTKNISFYEKLGFTGYKTEKLPREETVFLFMKKE